MLCNKALHRSHGITAAAAHTRVASRTLMTAAPRKSRPTCLTYGATSACLLHARRRGLATHASSEPQSIAVIGGGITGLTTAHFLAKSVPVGTKITVYEASDRIGGWLDTQKVEFEQNGQKSVVQFERGPRTLRSYARDTWKMDDLVLFTLLNDLDIMPSFRPGGTRYVRIDGNITAVTPKNMIKLLWKPMLKGFWRMKRNRLGTFADRSDKRLPKDMSVGEFLRMAAGESRTVDQFASAVLHGIWGGDIDRLSMQSVMPKPWHNYWLKEPLPHLAHLPAHELALVTQLLTEEVRDMVKLSHQGALIAFPEGMGSIPKAMAKSLRDKPNVEIKLGQSISKVEFDSAARKVMRKNDVETFRCLPSLSTADGASPAAYDKVISTINSKHLFRLAPKHLPALASTESVTITAVNVWYPKEGLNHPYQGLGYLLPRHDNSSNDLDGLLGVFFDSDALPKPFDEPNGTKMFVLMKGTYAEEDAKAKVREILHDHLGIDPDERCIMLARTNKDCIPQHHVGHRELMARADGELSAAFNGQLAVAGPSYSAVGVVGSMRAGYDMATQVTDPGKAAVGDTGLARFRGDEKLQAVDRHGLQGVGRLIPDRVSKIVQWLR
ncbi:uncharacterized protein VDAG_04485 [Verticillium dahliae VdLs.17]|uniref:Protoporphyrinogen oxidase n=1 Tax=Verticillium dahliae (strain VdLs.17 / ATCC MYA-4575 / FGSC 10137) TaxID=498257 RepID=G2X2G1_VERDV|nr:uncharacterized protein VDAG_04485 [Verticillium dahliae VdLs.17]EGY23047.1 hypothetical protein VDAG_04485 [Verticillium dahliae VdLs.17]